MSLTTKQLQARARLTYASRMPVSHLPTCFAHSATLAFSKPAPVMGQATRIPRPSLASDLFALGVTMSQAFGTYDSIACSAGIGRNLSARA